MAKEIRADRARQAKTGRPVLIVLIVALLLAMVAWAGVEIWGEHIDTPAADAASGGQTDGSE